MKWPHRDTATDPEHDEPGNTGAHIILRAKTRSVKSKSCKRLKTQQTQHHDVPAPPIGRPRSIPLDIRDLTYRTPSLGTHPTRSERIQASHHRSARFPHSRSRQSRYVAAAKGHSNRPRSSSTSTITRNQTAPQSPALDMRGERHGPRVPIL